MGYYKRLMIEAMQPKEEPPMEVLLPKGYEMTITPQPWIPVEERLPERNEIVLAVDQGGVTVGSYSPMLEDWWTLQVDRMSPGAVVTHWMPLPEPPGVK